MKKKFFLLFLICISSLCTAAVPSKDFVTDCFYGLLLSHKIKKNVSGVENLSEPENAYFLEKASEFYSLTHWSFLHGAESVADFMFPSCHSLIENSTGYDPYSDSGEWIKGIVSGAPEEFMITRPSEIEKAENELKDFEGLENQEDVIQETFYSEVDPELPEAQEKTAETGRSVKNKDSRLAVFTYEDEFLGIQYGESSRIVVRGDSKNLVRFFYDGLMRIEKKETWIYAGNIDSSRLLNTQLFRYDGDTSVPSSSMLKGTDFRQELKYDKKGRVIQSSEFLMDGDEEYQNSRTSWIFMDDGRVQEKKYEIFNYRKGKKRRLLNIESKKEKYQYKVSDSVPDYYYFENDELRMKTEYSTESDYITTVLFNGGFVIESYYENHTKKKEVFLLNGVVNRIKKYEI